jgi:hypothetical protein
MRHAPPIRASPDTALSTVKTMTPSSVPRLMPTLVKLPHRPRRPSGAFSMPNSAAPPHSPPAAMPCTIRSRTSRIGAAAPMVEDVGRQPMSTVHTPMVVRVMTSMGLRPSLSPKWPTTSPPSGRERKPAPKVRKATRVPVRGSRSGKNTTGKTRAAARP